MLFSFADISTSTPDGCVDIAVYSFSRLGYEAAHQRRLLSRIPPRRALVVAMDGVNAQKSLTRINYIDNALESKGIDRSFARWFQEKSVSEMKDVVRKRLSLSKDTDIHLAHLCYNRSMFLRDDDDFDMFRHFSLSAQSVDVAFSLPSDTTQNVRHVSTTPSTGTVQPVVSTPIPVADTPQPPEPKKRKLNNSKKAAVPVEPQEILPVAPIAKSKPPKSKATTSRADKEVVPIPAPAPAPEPVPSTRTSKRKRADSVVAKPPPPAILKAKARASSVPPSSPQPAEGSLLSLKKKRKLKKKLTEVDAEEAATESNDFARDLAKVISSVTAAAVEGKEPTPPRQRRKSAVAKAKADLASASNDNGISSDNHDVPSHTHSEPEPSASPAPENKKTPKKKKDEKLDPALLKAKEEQLAAARARLASSTVNAASTSSVVADSSINGHADASTSVSTKTNVTKKKTKKAKEKEHNVNGSSVVPSPPPPDSDAESDVVAPVAGPSTRSKSNLTQAKTATFVKDKGKKEIKGQAKEVAAEVGKGTDSSEPQRSKHSVKLVPTMVGREKAEQGKLNGKVAPPGLPDTDTDSESSSSENSEVIAKNQSAKGKIQRMPPRIMEGNGELAELIRPRKSRVNLDKFFKQVEEEEGEEEEGGILEEDEDEDWGKKKRSKASVRRAQSSSESEFEADDSPDTPVQTARPLPFTSTSLPGLRSATPPLSPQIQLVAPSSSQISKKPLAPLTSQVPPAIPAPDTPDDVIENVTSPEIMAPMEVDDIEPSDEPPKPSPRLSPTKIIKRMKGPTHSPRTLDRLHSSQSPLMFRRKLNHVGDSAKLLDFVAPSRSQSQSSSTTPVEKDDWTCLRNSPSIPDESVSMMVDELQSSPQNNLQLNMEVEAEAEAEEQEEPLFINTETQIPFPFSQYQPERTPSPEVADDEGVPDSEDDDDDDEEAVAAAVRTNLHTPVSVYPRLTDIASQSKVFSRPQRVTRATAASQKTQSQMRNTASMYGSLVARDSDSDSDSGSDEAEAPSHIPKSRTAGRRK